MNQGSLARQLEGHHITNIGDGWKNRRTGWMERIRNTAVLLI